MSFSGFPGPQGYSVGSLRVTGTLFANTIDTVSGNLVLKSAGTTALTLSTTAVTSALKILAPDGTAGAPAYSFTSETTSGLFFNAANGTFDFRKAGTTVWQTASTLLNLGASIGLSWGTADLVLKRKAAGRLTAGGSAGGGLTINVATTTLASVTGASVTATNLVPARAQVIGVATYVTVALGTGSGTTGYTVGDGSDADRFGAVTGTIVGTDTDSSTDATADPRMTWSTSAQNIVITAAGGNFDGSGTIRVEVYYLGDTAPTS